MLSYIPAMHDVDTRISEESAVQHTHRQLAFWYRTSLHWLDYDKRSEVGFVLTTIKKCNFQIVKVNCALYSKQEHFKTIFIQVAWALITNENLARQLGLINSSTDSKPTKGLPPIRLLMADVNYVSVC